MGYISAATSTLLKRYDARRALFFRIATPTPFLAWAGFGSIAARMQNVAVGSETYAGTGQLGNLPELQQFLNGQADRIEFTLSAHGTAAEQLQALDLQEVDGVAVHVARSVFDENWQIAVQPIPVAALVADYISVGYQQATHDQSAIASMTLSTHYGDVIAHTKPALTYWTPTHQKRRDPDDISCDNVFTYQRNYHIAWPQF